ncbi:P-loop containing nucleoside triphosphate hydrolase protein [Bombardia bombarda]|uniref:P-loop containing nucleoside triphosphate hydrolase protein n=1 Tax=Bombardia bombarda TaxID=252184 RepID=A0AA39XNI1_9PEZI|nr:P-loop containing nucleoside triphosphate hydrolase protein [Bombardia bombarda]
MKEPVQDAIRTSPIGAALQLPIRTPQDASSTFALGSDAAVLRLLELLTVAAKKSLAAESEPNTPTASESTTKEDEPQIERASMLDYKRVDEVWDEKSGKYKIVGSTSSKADELDRYVFVVRDRIDMRTQVTTSYIDMKSASLRDILREMCKDIRGVSLADVTPSIERKALFHVREELKSYRERIAGDSEGMCRKHLDLLVNYTETTYKPTVEHLSVLLERQEITYDLLWALFSPNTEVYTTCQGTGASRCALYNLCEERVDMDGSKYMYIEGRYLNSDGKSLGEATTGIKIPIFRGAKRIQHLQAYPLQYHAEKERVRQELIHYGRNFVSLIGIHHQQYEGKAFFLNEKGLIVGRYVKSRIVVDAIGFQETRADYPCPRVHKVKKRYSWDTPDTERQFKLEDIHPDQLEERDFLICSPTVFGFSLDSKTFLEFAVANISDVEWSQASFDDVKIPEEQKKPIWALTSTYLNRAPGDGLTDLVRGKGHGINFLLYGPPGVGKTLTAETLADTLKVPLYAVPAGQIGVDPVKVEAILTTVFKIASRWKAILLIDEADIFMAQRSSDNLQLNALVSVFLRELEHYDGILFLTTNRLQTFDEAIISRIHVALKYDELREEARRAVWQSFVDRAKTRRGNPACSGKVLDELAKKKMNGREIRNAVFVAQSMAEHEGTVLKKSHLEDAIASKRQFHRDFNGVGAVENLHSYN